MNDYDKLKNLLKDVRKLRAEIEESTKKANDLFVMFDTMNNDCDVELDEIDERIEEILDERDETPESRKLDTEMKKLKEKRVLVEQAVDLLDEIGVEFEKIAQSCEDISVGY